MPSSVARARWARVVPRVRPVIEPRACGSQCGAPSPANAGTKYTPPCRVDRARERLDLGGARSGRGRRAATAPPRRRRTPSPRARSCAPSPSASGRAQQAARRRHRLAAGVHQDERARAVRAFASPGVEAALAEQRRLLVAGDAGDRQRRAEDARASSDDLRRRHDLGQQRRGDAEQRRAARRPRRASRGRAAACAMRWCVGGVDARRRSAARRARCRRCRTRARRGRASRACEQPLELRPREVRVEDEAGALRGRSSAAAARAQRSAVRRSCQTIAGCDRPAGLALPQHRRLALVRDADRRDVARLDAGVAHRRLRGRDDASQISSGSCSTQPGCGKCCGARGSRARARAAQSSTTRQVVPVVP